MDARRQAAFAVLASDATLLLVFNAHHDVVNFTLPDIPEGDNWTCLLDTNMPVRAELPKFSAGDAYQVTGRSLLLFALEAPSRATQRVFDRLEEQLTTDDSEQRREFVSRRSSARKHRSEAVRLPQRFRQRLPGTGLARLPDDCAPLATAAGAQHNRYRSSPRLNQGDQMEQEQSSQEEQIRTRAYYLWEQADGSERHA